MPKDSIFPSRETAFDSFITIVVPYLVSNGARFGINTARRTVLTNAAANWTAAYAKTTDRGTRTKNDVADKNAAKASLQVLVRETCRALPVFVLTPTDRNTLNLRLRDRATPTPVPATKPVVQVDTRMRLQHTVHYFDSSSNSRAKPKGVLQCEIWYYISPNGAPPARQEDYCYLAVNRATPYTAHFEGADAGKAVYYVLRWMNTRNEPGPWSAVVMATITG